MIGSGNGGQVALVQVIRRQPNRSAAASRAGNHMAACESPNSTTVVEESASPETQGWSEASV